MMLATAIAFVLLPQGSDGNLAGTAVSLFPDSSTAAANAMGSAAQGFLKSAGFKDVPPPPHPPTTDRPDFSPGVVPWSLAGLVVDGFSTNVNWVASTATGIATAASDGGTGWAGIVFSTTRATLGITGSVIEQEALASDVAADVFQYVFPDSKGIASYLIGQTRRALNGSEVRLASPTTAPPADLIALDLFVPMLLGPPSLFGNVQAAFFGVVFTVSDATKGLVPTSWWGTTTPSGAAVFRSDWNSVSRTWTQPSVFLQPSQLGLSTLDDVTALSWDSRHGRFLFASPVSQYAPIMFVDLNNLGMGAVPFVLPSGDTVAKAAGLRPHIPIKVDDIDAICAIDPRVPNWGAAVGAPVVGPGGPGLRSNVLRSNAATSGEGDQVAALLCAGGGRVALASELWAVLWLGVAIGGPLPATAPAGPPVLLGVWPRPLGMPVQFAVPVPSIALKGVADFQWQETDGFAMTGTSPWVRIRF